MAACENLSKTYQIVMKFSGFLSLYEDRSAIDFRPQRSICLAVRGPKVGQFSRCYRHFLFNNLRASCFQNGEDVQKWNIP